MVLGISVLAAVLVLLMIFFIMRSKFSSDNQVHQRLKDLGGNTVKSHDEELERMSFMERTVKPFLHDVGNFLVRFAPSSIHDSVEHKIILAGKQNVWSANAFIVLWLFSLVAFFFLAHVMFSKNPNLSYIQRVVFYWLFVAVGALFPFMVINSIIRKRQKLISRQLPEVLDLLSVSVQAGLSFDGSVRRIVERMTGPLIDECKRVYQDVQMGAPRARSLQAMARRCDVDDVYLFITAVVQAERLGTSMGKTLTNQADNMRERRKQKAKAEALKAPVKIIFPLVIFIFPAIFVVALLPPILSALKSAGR